MKREHRQCDSDNEKGDKDHRNDRQQRREERRSRRTRLGGIDGHGKLLTRRGSAGPSAIYQVAAFWIVRHLSDSCGKTARDSCVSSPWLTGRSSSPLVPKLHAP